MISKTILIACLSITKKKFKTKIKSYWDEVTDFCNKEIPKADDNHICLAVISFGSALEIDDDY